MRTILSVACVLLGIVQVQSAETDKTLVAWVTVDNLSQRGGSALTIQCGDLFDGIVFGERQPRRWMAGSNGFGRTQTPEQQVLSPEETVDSQALLQMAVVYAGGEIRLFRDGKPYASYAAENIDLLSQETNFAVFGLRHIRISRAAHFVGTVEDARIYDRALTVEELQSLSPNQESDLQPYAWWDFEDGRAGDRTGRFPHVALLGGAKVEQGRLVLGPESILVAARSEKHAETVAKGNFPMPPFVPETPTMPEEVPDTWLTYHLAHPGPGVGLPGDPNCAFFYKGRYHLHYIYRNQQGFAFAHVSSRDMVTWKWHTTVLAGSSMGHGMFSGTGFFTKDGRPAIIYHGQGSGRNHIAYALDDNLDQWTEPQAIEVKTADGEDVDMRHWDPDCWLNGDTYYAISGGAPPHLIKSKDLENWSSLGLLLHEDMPDLGVSPNEDVSCANMFKIGDRWMLLCISHKLGCRYYLGDFKDERYLPDFHAMMNWKDWNFFAPESLLAPDGRRIMWAWCRLENGGAQTAIQSLPRELSLPEDGVLRIKPLRELEKLRYDEKRVLGARVKDGGRQLLEGISGDTVELRLAIKPTSAKRFGVEVFCGDAGEGFPISLVPGEDLLTMGDIRPPVSLGKGERIDLRIFLDKSMVEVFVNDRQAAVYMQPHEPENAGIALFCEGGDMEADVTAWKMRSIYE